MPNRFTTRRIIQTDSHGVDRYFIEVTHSTSLDFKGNIGDTINYVSTDGLNLDFTASKSAGKPKAPGTLPVVLSATKKVSTFKLGIDGQTFSGNGFFTLIIRYRIEGEPDEEDPISILRSGGAGGNPDTMNLVATFVREELV